MQRKTLAAVSASAAVSAALAIAINVATDTAPRWLVALKPWAWVLVIIFAVAGVVVAVWQRRLENAGQPREPSSVAGRGAPQELPRDVSHFTARGSELARLHAMARDGGVVAIAGKPGIGKSTLAVHAAYSISARYPDGQIFIDLKGLGGNPLPFQAGMLHVINSLTGSETLPAGEEDLAQRYRSTLAAKRLILILDDAESESQVRPLLPPNDRCLALITSRRVLAALTEAPPPLILDTLNEDDALDMLRAIAGAGRIDADIASSSVMAQQCGALPLALRIAAAKLRRRPHWTVATLVARLSDERRRLDELRIADLEVRACIALSYEDLSSSDAAAFRSLSVIPGRDFTPEVAGAAIGSAPAAAQAVLEELADAQLLEQRGAARYRYHDLIRIYAAEKFSQEEDADHHGELLRRILTVYTVQLNTAADAMNLTSSVGALSLPGPSGDRAAAVSLRNPGEEASQWIQRERANLIAALTTASHSDGVIAWQLARPLLLFLENRSSIAELAAVLKIAEAAVSPLHDTDLAASVRYFQARVARLSGQPSEAINLLRESEQYYLRANKGAEAAEVLLVLGQTCRENDALEAAAEAFATAFQIRLAADDRAGAAGVLIEVAIVAKDTERLEDAARILAFAVSLIESEPGPGQNRIRLAWAHENLGAILKHLGRTEEAAVQHELSLATFAALGHDRGQAYAGRNLGDLALRRGVWPEAESRYVESLLRFREIGDRRGEVQSLGHLGVVWLRTGRRARGVSALIQALFLAWRSNYLKAMVKQLWRSSPQKGQRKASPAASPALTRLVNAVETARENGI